MYGGPTRTKTQGRASLFQPDAGSLLTTGRRGALQGSALPGLLSLRAGSQRFQKRPPCAGNRRPIPNSLLQQPGPNARCFT